MNGMARGPADPVESAMEMALAPGLFISEGASYSFVRGLEEVAQQIGGIIEALPDRAVALYETFIAGCYEKAEEVDDSSGGLGAFGGSLFCGWVTARQAAAADPADTVARLLAWMDNDQYGFCFGIEKDIASALDDAGRAACVRCRGNAASFLRRSAHRADTSRRLCPGSPGVVSALPYACRYMSSGAWRSGRLRKRARWPLKQRFASPARRPGHSRRSAESGHRDARRSE